VDDYGYLNARVRAMNARLFKEADYVAFLSQAELKQFAESLLASHYAEEMSSAQAEAGLSLQSIEKALRQNLHNTFQKVLSMCSDEPLRLISLLLNRWDLYNIKTILRGKQANKGVEEILAAVIPIGELDEPRLLELARQPDIKAVADMLATWGFPYASPLARAMPEFAEKGDLALLDRALDEYYFERSLSQTKEKTGNEQLVREIIREQIDYLNVVIALKLVGRKERLEAKEFKFVPGGRLKHTFLSGLAQSKGLVEAMGELEKAGFGPSAKVPVEASTLPEMERSLEGRLVEKWGKLFSKDPLSVSSILGFLGRKFNEFVNLRIIARGKAHSMPLETIRGELVFV
jgi:V/A-type H+-transporting ATPase subunit C